MSALARTPEARTALAQFQAIKETRHKKNNRRTGNKHGSIALAIIVVWVAVFYGYATIWASYLLGLLWAPLYTITVILLWALPVLWTGRIIGRHWQLRQLNRRIARYRADQIIFDVPSKVFKAWWRALEDAGIRTNHPLAAPAEHTEVIYRLAQLRREIDWLESEVPDNESDAERAEREELVRLAKAGMAGLLTETVTVLAEQIAFTNQRAATRDLSASRIQDLLAD